MRPLASTPLAGGSPRSVESLSHPTRSPSQETRTVLVHTNYNTESVRKDGGFEVTMDAVKKLKLKHKEHIAAYGEGRLTGNHETTDIHTFSWCRQPWSFDPGQPRDVVE